MCILIQFLVTYLKSYNFLSLNLTTISHQNNLNDSIAIRVDHYILYKIMNREILTHQLC